MNDNALQPAASGLLADHEIEHLSLKHGMISPFVEKGKSPGKIGYGLSSYGYDIRLGSKFRVFTNISNGTVDPKVDCWGRVSRAYCVGGSFLLPPHSFVLAESVETFIMPTDVLGICVGKSTYARCGIIINVTPLNPGWRGVLTIEISNTTPCPAQVYVGEGIAQILFFRGSTPCRAGYEAQSGTYQDQEGMTPPRIGVKNDGEKR